METQPKPFLHHKQRGGEEMGQMQGQKPPEVLILTWWMERKAGPAVAAGVLLWFMLPPVGCCHCHPPSYSNQRVSPCLVPVVRPSGV